MRYEHVKCVVSTLCTVDDSGNLLRDEQKCVDVFCSRTFDEMAQERLELADTSGAGGTAAAPGGGVPHAGFLLEGDNGFLARWNLKIPAELAGADLKKKEDLRPPFFGIHNKVAKVDLAKLDTQSPVKRLEQLWMLTTVWYQKDLEELIGPALAPGEKAAGWLLKYARQVTVKCPSSGEDEAVFVPKFRSYLKEGTGADGV